MADYTQEGREYTEASIAKLSDDDFAYLITRARTLNEPEEDIQWLLQARDKKPTKKAAAEE